MKPAPNQNARFPKEEDPPASGIAAPSSAYASPDVIYTIDAANMASGIRPCEKAAISPKARNMSAPTSANPIEKLARSPSSFFRPDGIGTLEGKWISLSAKSKPIFFLPIQLVAYSFPPR